MSYNSTDKSGEAIPFDPFILLPFGVGKSLSSILRTPFGGIQSGVTRQIIRETEKLGIKTPTIPKTNILESITNLFKKPVGKVVATGSGAGAVVTANAIPKLTTLSKSTSAAIIAGTIPLTTGLATLFVNTQGGQEAIDKAKDTADKSLDIGKDLSQFIQANGQLLSIFLIIGGAALLVGAFKK